MDRCSPSLSVKDVRLHTSVGDAVAEGGNPSASHTRRHILTHVLMEKEVSPGTHNRLRHLPHFPDLESD